MNKKRILVVDDEKAIRMMIVLVLNSEDYIVDPAENGLKAIDYLGRFSYDLIITDYLMPEMDGLELVKQIKLLSPTTPIIMLTGASSAYKQIKREVKVCLLKPFNIYELLDWVKKSLGEEKKGE